MDIILRSIKQLYPPVYIAQSYGLKFLIFPLYVIIQIRQVRFFNPRTVINDLKDDFFVLHISQQLNAAVLRLHADAVVDRIFNQRLQQELQNPVVIEFFLYAYAEIQLLLIADFLKLHIIVEFVQFLAHGNRIIRLGDTVAKTAP